VPKHVHTFEFKNQPKFTIPQMKVVYEWDICKGSKRMDEITLKDLESAFSAAQGSPNLICLDLEPSTKEPMFLQVNPRYISLEGMDREMRRGQYLMNALRAKFTGTVSIYGFPFSPDNYVTALEHKERFLFKNNYSAIGKPYGFGGVTAFDLYRDGDDNAYEAALPVNLSAARHYGQPLHVWYSPWRKNTEDEVMVPNDLIDKDINVISQHLTQPGDAIVWWGPRVVNQGGKFIPREWNPKWKWINTFRKLAQA
jgi:hypothetical protein